MRPSGCTTCPPSRGRRRRGRRCRRARGSRRSRRSRGISPWSRSPRLGATARCPTRRRRPGSSPSGDSGQRFGVEQVEAAQLALDQRLRDPACVETLLARARSSQGRRWAASPASRSPRPLACAGISSRPAPSVSAMPSFAASSSRASTARAPSGPAREPLAPQDHDLARPVLGAGFLKLCDQLLGLGLLEELGARLRAQASCRGGARPCAGAGRRSGRPRPGSPRAPAPRGRTPGLRPSPAAPARRAPGAAPAAARRPTRESRCGRAQALPQQAREQEALLVGAPAARERAGLGARPLQAGGGLLQGTLPGDGSQLAAVAHQRLGDPSFGELRVGEASAVAQPAVVHLVVVAGQDSQHALVAHGQRHVALRRAQRAHRARVLHVPGPAPGSGSCARSSAPTGHSSTMLPLNGAMYGLPVEGRHVGVGAALEQHQLVVLGYLLAEAHAAVAQDAALPVDRDRRRELKRLDEVALGVDEARLAAAPAEGDVLQRALPALVAHGTVQADG